MKRHALSVLGLFFLLVGCASTPQLSSEARAHFGAVRIDDAVDAPSELYYTSQGGVLIGGLVGAAIDISRGDDIELLARGNGIRIDRIVKEEAEKAFRQSGKLELTDAAGADVATLKISVTMYGFSVPTGFTSELVPLVAIKCTLLDASGKTIWKADQTTRPLGNPVPGRTSDEFKADPKLIEAAWRAAAQSVLADIVSHM